MSLQFNSTILEATIEALDPYSQEFTDYLCEKIVMMDREGKFENEVFKVEFRRSLFETLTHFVRRSKDKKSLGAQVDHLVTLYPQITELDLSLYRSTFIETFEYFFGENWTTEATISWKAFYDQVLTMTKKSSSKIRTTKTVEDIVNRIEIEEMTQELDKEPLPLSELAKTRVRALLEAALDDAIASLEPYIQKKVREILIQALDQEVKEQLRFLNQKVG